MYVIRPVSGQQEILSLTGPDACQPAVDPDAWTAPNRISLVAVTEDGSPIGCVLLTPDKRVADTIKSFRLAWLYVIAEHRGQGVARALLREAAARAGKVGVNRIHVCLRPRNCSGVAMFDSLEPSVQAVYIVCLTASGF
ncbi:MAG TPA: GNAT family N-acetyltransferase [Symbiobacteriaceae bacterium]|nr:GNAT family N-acetyltransferase [Symbiobacteriaceae bacterium]